MAIPVSELKGMNRKLLAMLDKLGIKNSDQLLMTLTTPSARKKMAGELGISERDILELANRCDLSRIKGVAGVYSDLLEHGGVDTVKELATRNPENLFDKIIETNGKKGLARRAPSIGLVKSWVEEAKSLPKLLTY